MGNEAVLKLKTDVPFDWIVADIRGVEKGTVMKMSGVGAAIASTGNGDIFAGITRREKIASDGRTRLALFRRGIFDMVAASPDTIAAGAWVTSSGTNLIRLATTAELILGKGIGITREEITAGSTGEVMVGGY